MEASVLRGSLTALITPFKNGKVDDRAFQRLVNWQITEGAHGLIPTGPTGESATLDYDEHQHVLELCIAAAKRRVPIIAGAGSNSTEEAIFLTQHAKRAGADAVLHVLPYYNKPQQAGIYYHIKAINDAVDIPLLIYNIPGRTAVDLGVATLVRCYELKNVVGIVDATANLRRVSLHRLALGPGFNQICGDDGISPAFMAHGGHGCMSVVSNIAPRLYSQFQTLCLEGHFTKALKIHDRLMPLIDALFVETNPGPVKYAASRLGLCLPDTRLPLVRISDASKHFVDLALEKAGLAGAQNNSDAA